MIETREMSQETTVVHDVLSLFRDKIVHDVMNPDTYTLWRNYAIRGIPGLAKPQGYSQVYRSRDRHFGNTTYCRTSIGPIAGKQIRWAAVRQ
jgi:hypothetical protein